MPPSTSSMFCRIQLSFSAAALAFFSPLKSFLEKIFLDVFQGYVLESLFFLKFQWTFRTTIIQKIFNIIYVPLPRIIQIVLREGQNCQTLFKKVYFRYYIIKAKPEDRGLTKRIIFHFIYVLHFVKSHMNMCKVSSKKALAPMISN